MWRLASLLLVAALGCKRAGDPGPPDPRGGHPFALRGELDQLRGADRELRDVEVGWIAEAERGGHRIAIVWIGLLGAEILDNDVGGFAFVRDDSGWRLAPPPGDDDPEISMSGDRDRLREALGGDYTLHKPDGLPVDQLGPHLLASAGRFRDALAANRPADAIAAFEDGARALGPGMVIHDNDGVDLLIEGRVAGLDRLELRDVALDGDHGRAILVATRGGDTAPMPVRLVRAGAGWAIDALGE